MALKWCAGKIAKKTVWAEGLFTIAVRAPEVAKFEPGQFLQVGYSNGDKHIHRPYSVASPWGPEIEFFIVLVDDGELTPYLWSLAEGQEIDVSQRAAGSFTLKKTPEAENLWLVATGTGLAPYIAMLRTAEPWERYQRIVVVHGVRLQSDLAYADELNRLVADHAGQLSYIPALTREQPDGYLHGRIPVLLNAGSLETSAGCEIRPENTAIMLCGNPAMLDDMESSLEKRGLRRHRSKSPGHIVLERYW